MELELSVIVPVYNEEDNVLPLAREIQSAMKEAAVRYEIVFVDDASTDGTWRQINEARKIDPHVRGLKHCRNGGQSAALWTGIQNSRGVLIATLDGDLQNDPADIPQLLETMKEFDFACGVRTKRRDSWLRRISSRVARKARKAALGVDFCDTGCAMRVFKRKALEGVFAFNGLHRFLPVLVHAGGWKTKELPINHRARVAGVSKYGLWNRMWRGIYDLFAISWYMKRRVGKIPCEQLEE